MKKANNIKIHVVHVREGLYNEVLPLSSVALTTSDRMNLVTYLGRYTTDISI